MAPRRDPAETRLVLETRLLFETRLVLELLRYWGPPIPKHYRFDIDGVIGVPANQFAPRDPLTRNIADLEV